MVVMAATQAEEVAVLTSGVDPAAALINHFREVKRVETLGGAYVVDPEANPMTIGETRMVILGSLGLTALESSIADGTSFNTIKTLQRRALIVLRAKTMAQAVANSFENGALCVECRSPFLRPDYKSPTNLVIASALAVGLTNSEIGEVLSLSYNQVKRRKQSMFTIPMRSNTQLITAAYISGMLPLES